MAASNAQNRALFDLFQQLMDPNHVLVPVESLTSSPTSSTGSASILEWNSNSDGELLDLDCLPPTDTESPPVSSSPMQLSQPLTECPVSATESACPQASCVPASAEDLMVPAMAVSNDKWTSWFGGLMPPAPVGLQTGATSAVTVVDGAFPSSVPAVDDFISRKGDDLDEICDEFGSHVWVGDSATFAPRKLVEEEEKADAGRRSPEPQHDFSSSDNNDVSLASTVMPPPLVDSTPEAPSMSMPLAGLMSGSLPSPSQIPLVPSALFNNLVLSPASSRPTSPVKPPAETETEVISIAEYFHRKALSGAEATECRNTEVPVVAEGPQRPDSVNSGLSYFTGPRSAHGSPLINATLFIDRGASNNGNSTSTESDLSADSAPALAAPRSSTIPTVVELEREDDIKPLIGTSKAPSVTPSRASTPAVPLSPQAAYQSFLQQIIDNPLTRSPNPQDSPVFRNIPGLFQAAADSGLFGPQSVMSSPSQSGRELQSPVGLEYPLASAGSPSPYSSRCNSRRGSFVEYENSGASSPEEASIRSHRISSPEYPRRDIADESPFRPLIPSPYPSPPAQQQLHEHVRFQNIIRNPSPSYAESDGAQSAAASASPAPVARRRRPSLQSIIGDDHERRRQRGLDDAPIPNIPKWLTDWSRSAVSNSRSIHVPPTRLRPPLPPLPVVGGGKPGLGGGLPFNRVPPSPSDEAEDTPPFSIRQDGAGLAPPRNDYYANAFPSDWSAPPARSSSLQPSNPSHPDLQGATVPPESNTNTHPYMTSAQRMSRFFNTPNSSSHSSSIPRSGSGTVRDLPNPYGTTPNPQYTGSTLPKDRTVPPPAPPFWGPQEPSQRRLRFAPLPPTPGYRPGPPPLFPPYPGPTPVPSMQYPFCGSGYIYQTPAPVPPIIVPPVIPPPIRVPPVPPVQPQPTRRGWTSSPTLNTNLLSPNSYPSHKKYWFTDATVVFRVENCLYRVHRHFFELHSTHFRQLLATYWYLPSNHLFLPDVKKVEFERLLSIFYPSDLTKQDITTVSGWTSMLDLSKKWDMPQVKALAVQKLAPLTTAVEKIAIAKKYDVTEREWLIPAYAELCARRSPLTLEEAEDLDLPTIIKVWEVQHAILALDCMCCDDKVVELVKDKFGFADNNDGVPFIPPSYAW